MMLAMRNMNRTARRSFTNGLARIAPVAALSDSAAAAAAAALGEAAAAAAPAALAGAEALALVCRQQGTTE